MLCCAELDRHLLHSFAYQLSYLRPSAYTLSQKKLTSLGVFCEPRAFLGAHCADIFPVIINACPAYLCVCWYFFLFRGQSFRDIFSDFYSCPLLQGQDRNHRRVFGGKSPLSYLTLSQGVLCGRKKCSSLPPVLIPISCARQCVGFMCRPTPCVKESCLLEISKNPKI